MMNVRTETPRTKGPLVFLDMDQQALDDAYDQEVYAPNRALVVERRKAASERARAVLGAPKRLTYGPGEYEGLDVFDCGIKGAPVNVFVHGGAWRRNVAADYALQAEPLVRAGAHSVIIDFINVDQAKGDLFPMYEQVRRALAWVWNNAQSFGGDRDRLHVSAHSSGSHLSGVVLTRGWQEEGLPKDFCKGAVLLSGMYDLAPVALSKRSSYVNFTPAMVERLSGGRYIGKSQHAAGAGLRHLRDAGVPAPDPRLRRGGEGRGQACRTAGRRGLQPLRTARDARQSLRPHRPGDAEADAVDRESNPET